MVPTPNGSDYTPKHGRHAARPGQAPSYSARRGASHGISQDVAPAQGATRLSQGAARPPASLGAQDALEAISGDAPRPIGVDPSRTGCFSTLASGQGAVLHDRDSASEAASAARHNFRKGGPVRMNSKARPQVSQRPRSSGSLSRPAVIGIVVVAAAVIVGLVLFVLNALNTVPTSLDTSSVPLADQRVEQTQDDENQGISYGGYTYSVQPKADGVGYAFVRQQGSEEPTVLFDLTGTPVTVVLYNGAFLIPENLGSSWDVVSWVMGDGSVPQQLTANGNPVMGDGTISSAKLEGSTLTLSFDNDTTNAVNLE